jgi:MFS family permease
MTLSILCYSIFSGVGYLAQAPWHLGALRFVAALGMGGEWSLGVALVMEGWPSAKRPLLGGVIGAAGNVGYALIAVIGMSVAVTPHSWRWVMLVGAAPAVLALLIIVFVPESEQWKAAVKQAPSQPFREIFSRALLGRTLLAIAFASVALIVTWCIVQWIPLWADQITHGGQPRAKAYAQLASAIGSVVGCLATPFLGGRMGQRPLYFGLCLGSLLMCNLLFRCFGEYGAAFLLAVGMVGCFTGAFCHSTSPPCFPRESGPPARAWPTTPAASSPPLAPGKWGR